MRHYSQQRATWLMLAFALGVAAVIGLAACAPGGAGFAPQQTGAGTTPQSTVTTPQGTITATASQGIVSGVVMAGPTCPIEPADHPCPPRPVPDRQVLIKTPQGATVAQAMTDQQGKFSLALPPGTYDLQVPGSRPYPIQHQPQQVTVVAGQTVQVQIMLDTGIR